MSQQTDANGAPLAGCLLYLFVSGTVATPTNVYSDFGLTLTAPNPLQADVTGRLPNFYLSDGTVHARLTDSSGVVIADYPSLQVLGPSSGGGGGGGVDPTSIASTGDMKFRPTSETLTGWVRANGQTVGSAVSGASQRANADTQNLFVYLWGVTTNAHCPVSGGRGVSGLADFQANKTIQLPDFRARAPVGLDDMGNTPAGILLASNVTSGGGDGVTTPGAWGGESNHVLIEAEHAVHTHGVNDPGHHHSCGQSQLITGPGGGSLPMLTGVANSYLTTTTTTGIALNTEGGNQAHNNMAPFVLGSWYLKL